MSERTDLSYHAALASQTRRQVLDAITASAEPRDAQSLALELSLHVTTVRFHLDQLEEARLVLRSLGAEKRRGRPRTLYVAVDTTDRDEQSREQLIEVLAGALAARDTDEGRDNAARAGWAWGSALTSGADPDSVSASDPSAILVEVLDELGFDPRPEGDVINLHACPFRDAARQHPNVVCEVHRGLIQQILAADPTATDVRLLPFVQPELCVVTLR